MPITKRSDGWYWGSRGPFATKQKAAQVGAAAHASGFKEENEMDNTLIAAAEFVGTLLHSATVTHFKHLQVEGQGSYAAHKALGAYYEEIIELVDDVAEAIQGAHDVILGPYATQFDNNSDEPLAYMVKLREYVRTKRKEIPQDSEIQNEVDNIANLINSTCYKLTRLQ